MVNLSRIFLIVLFLVNSFAIFSQNKTITSKYNAASLNSDFSSTISFKRGRVTDKDIIKFMKEYKQNTGKDAFAASDYKLSYTYSWRWGRERPIEALVSFVKPQHQKQYAAYWEEYYAKLRREKSKKQAQDNLESIVLGATFVGGTYVLGKLLVTAFKHGAFSNNSSSASSSTSDILENNYQEKQKQEQERVKEEQKKQNLKKVHNEDFPIPSYRTSEWRVATPVVSGLTNSGKGSQSKKVVFSDGIEGYINCDPTVEDGNVPDYSRIYIRLSYRVGLGSQYYKATKKGAVIRSAEENAIAALYVALKFERVRQYGWD